MLGYGEMTSSWKIPASSILFAFLLLALFAVGSSSAQTEQVVRLDGGNCTYAFGVNERGELQTLYWGGRLGSHDSIPPAHSLPEWASFDSSYTTTPQEYAGWGAGLFTEPALKVSFVDGSPDLVLHFVRATPSGSQSLDVLLKDISREIYVTLRYSMDPESGILARSVSIENLEKQPVLIEQAAAAQWTLPPASYALTYLTGRWAGEWTLNQELIQGGARVIESRRGTTGHQANPWFAISRQGGRDTAAPVVADEEHGEVWFGALAWSGSWRITVERTQLDAVRVTGGFNPFDFGYKLKPGEHLETPVFYGGYSDHGLGGASRLLHRFEIARILPQAPDPKPRPVIYNSWEATEFKVDEAGQVALAEKAASIGVDRFVMDDGWFGKRNDDHAGLGDWYVNPQKFPHGLQPLIRYVNSLGMDFGLWFEPEMVNPDSDLYRQHPEWAMNFPGRPRSEARNQLVLNLAREDVKEYIFGVLDKILSENKIKYIKWDMNRHFGEPGWPEAPLAEQKEIWVKYVRNVYEIIDRLRARHPSLDIEACSGGGGRVDLGILERVNIVWTSDNTEAFDRLGIQEGFSFAYAPKVMSAWVTDVPNLNGRSAPLAYRFLVAMQGALGIGANLNKWSPEDFALAARMISTYKSIRETVQQGDLYRLCSPREGALTANQYISAHGKQAVLFAFLHSQQYLRPLPALYLRGLDADALYRVKRLDEKVLEQQPVLSGSFLMQHGLNLDLRGDYDSTLVILERIE